MSRLQIALSWFFIASALASCDSKLRVKTVPITGVNLLTLKEAVNVQTSKSKGFVEEPIALSVQQGAKDALIEIAIHPRIPDNHQRTLECKDLPDFVTLDAPLRQLHLTPSRIETRKDLAFSCTLPQSLAKPHVRTMHFLLSVLDEDFAPTLALTHHENLTSLNGDGTEGVPYHVTLLADAAAGQIRFEVADEDGETGSLACDDLPSFAVLDASAKVITLTPGGADAKAGHTFVCKAVSGAKTSVEPLRFVVDVTTSAVAAAATTATATETITATATSVAASTATTTTTATATATATASTTNTNTTVAASAVPPDPINLNAISPSTTQIDLNWTSGGGTTADYRIAYTAGATAPADCASGIQIGESLIDGVTHSMTGLTQQTQYSFRICAINTNATPDASSGVTVTATTQTPQPQSATNSYPTISTIANQSTNRDIAITGISFVVDEGGGADEDIQTLTITATSSNTMLIPDGNITINYTDNGAASADALSPTIDITPAPNQTGITTITIVVYDDGLGTPSVTQTFDLTVNAVNIAPTISDISDQVTTEDVAKTGISFSVDEGGGAAEDIQTLTVTATSSNTTLVPNANITINYNDNGAASANALSPTIDLTPAPNQNGVTTITVTVQDSGTGNLTSQDSFTVTVSSVNDAPTISSIADQSTNEETAKSGISFSVDEGGGADEDTQTLTVTATSSNTTLVPNGNITVNYTDGGAASAHLLSPTIDMTPAADQVGQTTITVTVQDNGTGLPTATQTFVLTVNGVNDSPTISSIADQTTTEDTQKSGIAFIVDEGGGSDEDNQTLSVTATSSNTALVPNGNITINYTDNGGSSGHLLSPTIDISPALDQGGQTTITVTVQDNGSGTPTATQSFVLTVNLANDVPTISDISNQTTTEGTASSGIAFTVDEGGGASEDTQTLTVSATSSNTTLVPNGNITINFTDNGAGSADSLTPTIDITPASDQNGVTTITVTVQDNGTGNLTSQDTFTLTVSAVNDAPTITSIADQTTNEDITKAGISFTVDEGGASDENSQTLTVTATSSNTTLVPNGNITVNYSDNGAASANLLTPTLSITPVSQLYGTTTITVTVQDSGTGLLTATEDFVLTVTSVNDNPTVSSITDRTTAVGTPVTGISFTVDEGGGVDEDVQALTLTAVSSNQTLVPNANITLNFADNGAASAGLLSPTLDISPAAGQSGYAIITVTASDNGTGTPSGQRTFAVLVGSTFDTTWKTDNTGVSASNQIKLPLDATGTYDFYVNWGDGSGSVITAWNDSAATHTYSSPGTYNVLIAGTISGFKFNSAGDEDKLLEISKWGSLSLANTGYNFKGASNLIITATDSPDLSNTTTFISMFHLCSSLTNVPNINSWNTSAVTNMTSMFNGATNFAGNLSNWDVSSVTTMASAFQNAANFNSDISGWNTISLKNLSSTFYGAALFNQNIGGWDTSLVTNMTSLFRNAAAFNQNINNWDVSGVVNMASMFFGASSFNQPLNIWDTSAVTTMVTMFKTATAFNQDISGWNTAMVGTMNGMFATASSFNQPVNSWDVSQVTDMTSIFDTATAFNQPLDNWNTSLVATMKLAFRGASAFNQSINSWNVTAVTDFDQMFFNASSFNQPLNGWNTSSATAISSMFYNATAFNQPLNNWNTANVTTLRRMFRGATNFNQPLNSWNTANVGDFSEVFRLTNQFNQDLNGWNTGSVTDMTSAFHSALVFNGNVTSWNTANVTTMSNMFNLAANFNQDISGWNVINVATMDSMLKSTSFNYNLGGWNIAALTSASLMLDTSALSTANYDALLMGWASVVTRSNVALGASGIQYSSTASSARNTLTTTYGWTITDGGLSP